MKRQTETIKTTLSFKAVDECSEKAGEFSRSLKLSERECLKFAITIDEILLKTFDFINENANSNDAVAETPVAFTTGTRLLRPYMCVEIKSKAFNAFASNEEEGSLLGNSILRNLGLSPEYTYVNGTNTYNFRMKKKSMNPFFKLIIALGLAVVCSLLGLLMAPEARTAILDNFLTPIYETFFNVLGCIAGPMVFLSVAWGIYGIGDAATLKQIGKKLLGSYVGTVFIVTILASVACVPLFSIHMSRSTQFGQGASSIFEMILNIIPKNIFSPFIEGNTLQIIFLAIVIGIALLFLGQKTNAVAKAVEQINYVVQFLIEFICRLVPFFVFIAIVEMMWGDSISVLATVGKFFAIFIGCALVMIVALLAYTSIKNKVSPITLVKKGLPTLLIALTTASSAAAFGTNLSACKESYGIDEKMTAFGVPLGMVIFKPTTAISYLTMSLFCCGAFDVQVSATWVATMIFTAAVLAVATPPIPGGAITAYTVMFTQLGIPPEALAIAIACDTIVDFIATGGDQFMIPLALLNQSNRLGMVKHDILKSNKSK